MTRQFGSKVMLDSRMEGGRERAREREDKRGAVNLELGGLEHALVADSSHSSEGSTFYHPRGHSEKGDFEMPPPAPPFNFFTFLKP